eukprot:1336714-Rhodomonas_salina.1
MQRNAADAAGGLGAGAGASAGARHQEAVAHEPHPPRMRGPCQRSHRQAHEAAPRGRGRLRALAQEPRRALAVLRGADGRRVREHHVQPVRARPQTVRGARGRRREQAWRAGGRDLWRPLHPRHRA